jgi:PTS system ascorbate-specific IIA component
MKTGILIITHGNLGRDMLETVTSIMRQSPLQMKTMSVKGDCNPDAEFTTASDVCTELDQGGGILVLTDLFGSTPSNIAARLLDRHNVRVISGVNVPMLLRVLNYPNASLDKLAEIATEGARNGVIMSTRKQAS